MFKNFADQTTVSARVRIYLDSGFPPTNFTEVMYFKDASNILAAQINDDMTVSVWNDVAGEEYLPAVTLSTGVWHTLEMTAVINGANGEARLWLDGRLVLNQTGINLGTNPIALLSTGHYVSSDPNPASILYIDDGVVCAEQMAAIPTLTLADHDTGQIGDQFATTTPLTSELYRFKLTRSGTVTVDNLRVNFTTGGGVANGDVTSGELWRDNNSDGLIDGGDTQIQGGVTASGDMLTFTNDFNPATGGTNYLVRATVANLVAGDTTTFSFGTADVDELEVVTESGSITNEVHTQDPA